MSFLSLGNGKMGLKCGGLSWWQHFLCPHDLSKRLSNVRDMLHATYRLEIAICDSNERLPGER
jgi:hypothetical protein